MDVIALFRNYREVHRALLPRLLAHHLGRRLRSRGSAASVIPLPLSPGWLRDEVLTLGHFTADWFSVNIPHLYPALSGMGRPFRRYLEIGCYEGLSTVWFGAYLRRSCSAPQLVCIDPFAGYPQAGEQRGAQVEANFDANISRFLGDLSVTKINKPSLTALPALIEAAEVFDVVYVDGSHRSLDVMTDAVLAWRLLADGGLMIFDDYLWAPRGEADRPLPAVNAFLDLLDGRCRAIDCYHQAIIEKRG